MYSFLAGTWNCYFNISLQFGRRKKKFRAKTSKVESNSSQELKTASQEKIDEVNGTEGSEYYGLYTALS